MVDCTVSRYDTVFWTSKFKLDVLNPNKSTVYSPLGVVLVFARDRDLYKPLLRWLGACPEQPKR